MRFARTAVTVAVLTAVTPLAACSNGLSKPDGAEASASSIKVGFMVPESGVYASIGTDISQAMKLFLHQHDNTLGGRTVQLVTVDEGSSPQTGTPAAIRLIQQDKVAVTTGVVNSATAAAIAPLFEKAQIPVVSLAQLQTTTPYWWVDSYPNYETSTAMADVIHEADPKGGVYLIADDYSQGHAVLAAMTALLKARGVKVAGTSYTPFGTTLDYQPFLSKIQNSGAEAVYAFYAGADAVRFVQQYAQFGLAPRTRLYASLSVTEGNLKAEGDAAVGVITDSEYSSQLDNAANKSFVAAYEKAYGEAPDVYAESEYSGLIALDQALSALKGQNVTGAQINDALRGLGQVTTPRGTWSFDKGQGPTQAIYLMQVQKEGGQLVNTILKKIGVYNTSGQKLH
jgi:branched-chain amino acid transport system substrate-binding protein